MVIACAALPKGKTVEKIIAAADKCMSLLLMNLFPWPPERFAAFVAVWLDRVGMMRVVRYKVIEQRERERLGSGDARLSRVEFGRVVERSRERDAEAVRDGHHFVSLLLSGQEMWARIVLRRSR